jgi:geranylgeranyl diphosphate synthase type II
VSFDLGGWAAQRRARIDEVLSSRITQPAREEDPGRLIEAVRYSLLAPGKRVRPLMALAAAQAVGSELGPGVEVAAAAVELVHCYSLVHDDLPAMDDDDVRRGQPTNHKVYGEATAILAGDGLLTLAFEWLAQAATGDGAPDAAARYLRATGALARGAGMSGMVRGQARDLGEPPPATLEAIERLHREKTGALFRAAAEVGAAAGGGSLAQIAALGRFGECYGVAFQHADDADDAEHLDFAEAARRRTAELLAEALQALASFDERARPLRALAEALAPPFTH